MSNQLTLLHRISHLRPPFHPRRLACISLKKYLNLQYNPSHLLDQFSIHISILSYHCCFRHHKSHSLLRSHPRISRYIQKVHRWYSSILAQSSIKDYIHHLPKYYGRHISQSLWSQSLRKLLYNLTVRLSFHQYISTPRQPNYKYLSTPSHLEPRHHKFHSQLFLSLRIWGHMKY